MAQVAVCSQINKKHKIQCGQSVQLLNVKPVGASHNQFKGLKEPNERDRTGFIWPRILTRGRHSGMMNGHVS